MIAVQSLNISEMKLASDCDTIARYFGFEVTGDCVTIARNFEIEIKSKVCGMGVDFDFDCKYSGVHLLKFVPSYKHKRMKWLQKATIH